MSGALAERVFARKLQKEGFEDVWIGERIPHGIDKVQLYPLFTDDLARLMREVIPPERQDAVATAVIVKARKPAAPRSG